MVFQDKVQEQLLGRHQVDLLSMAVAGVGVSRIRLVREILVVVRSLVGLVVVQVVV